MIPVDLLEDYLIDQECVYGTVPALSASMAISSGRSLMSDKRLIEE